LKALDLPKDHAKLDVDRAVAGDVGEEPPVIEVKDGLLEGGVYGSMPAQESAEPGGLKPP
jgi:hypothetical protein